MIYTSSIKKYQNNSFKEKIVRGIKKIFNLFNLELSRNDNWAKRYIDSVVEMDKRSKKAVSYVDKLMIGSLPSQWSIIQSLKHIKNNKLKGDIVETGVFHGGGLIFINEILKNIKMKKKLWGYDTFEGVPNISLKNELLISGKRVKKETSEERKIYRNLHQVKKMLLKKGFTNKTLPKLVVGDTRFSLNKKKKFA